MASYGLLILEPSLHYWYNFMSRLFPNRDFLSTFKKMALGQIVYGPPMTVVFFSVNAALQGQFLSTHCAGHAYGTHPSDVEHAAAEQMDMDMDGHSQNSSSMSIERSPKFGKSEIQLETVVTAKDDILKPPIKGFSFEDNRLMNGNWFKEPTADNILLFFRILAVCHTAIPEQNEETGTFTYEAESPDEVARGRGCL